MDGTNLEILTFLASNKEKMFTVVDIVEEVFGELNRDDKLKKIAFINYRLGKLIEEDLVECIKENGIKYYTAALEGVYYEGNCVLTAAIDTIGLGEAIIIKHKDDTFTIHFIQNGV